MPTTADPLAAYYIAESLRQCVHERVTDTPAGEPARSCVIAGAIAWDDCECGQLVVAITNSWLSANFPTPAPANLAVSRCGPGFAVFEYTISILRCAPSGVDDAQPPSCADLDAAAQQAVLDAYAVRWGAWCCLKTWRKARHPEFRIADFQLGSQPMVGPEGMCQGSNLQVLVGVMNACPPCDADA